MNQQQQQQRRQQQPLRRQQQHQQQQQTLPLLRPPPLPPPQEPGQQQQPRQQRQQTPPPLRPPPQEPRQPRQPPPPQEPLQPLQPLQQTQQHVDQEQHEEQRVRREAKRQEALLVEQRIQQQWLQWRASNKTQKELALLLHFDQIERVRNLWSIYHRDRKRVSPPENADLYQDLDQAICRIVTATATPDEAEIFVFYVNWLPALALFRSYYQFQTYHDQGKYFEANRLATAYSLAFDLDPLPAYFLREEDRAAGGPGEVVDEKVGAEGGHGPDLEWRREVDEEVAAEEGRGLDQEVDEGVDLDGNEDGHLDGDKDDLGFRRYEFHMVIEKDACH
ncbi:hypothetical protein EPUS_08115 [Endocarpon pusillum Z07020]|uniref:Uncharacterized protein n=1 Tax=Endocarpon pusillum (strain Z07020 / HMAS-L-300199) TaxID=1263415 RepID=U1G9A5_ENDPU|nr:uncharacterized protein EPUS_08115 [Endocarpon pusillum Z07020]ERF74067.1 hypothetical protein EPUS_08115 [Endocarpon pusillum Z07020]